MIPFRVPFRRPAAAAGVLLLTAGCQQTPTMVMVHTTPISYTVPAGAAGTGQPVVVPMYVAPAYQPVPPPAPRQPSRSRTATPPPAQAQPHPLPPAKPQR